MDNINRFVNQVAVIVDAPIMAYRVIRQNPRIALAMVSAFVTLAALYYRKFDSQIEAGITVSSLEKFPLLAPDRAVDLIQSQEEAFSDQLWECCMVGISECCSLAETMAKACESRFDWMSCQTEQLLEFVPKVIEMTVYELNGYCLDGLKNYCAVCDNVMQNLHESSKSISFYDAAIQMADAMKVIDYPSTTLHQYSWIRMSKALMPLIPMYSTLTQGELVSHCTHGLEEFCESLVRFTACAFDKAWFNTFHDGLERIAECITNPNFQLTVTDKVSPIVTPILLSINGSKI